MQSTKDVLMNSMRNPREGVGGALRIFLELLAFADAKRTRGDGERIVVPIWWLAKHAGGFVTMAHIQRYEWVKLFVHGLFCLDAGCGSGYGINYLSQRGAVRAAGVDLSYDAISFAKKHYKRTNLEFFQMSVLDLKFDDGTFDAVVSFDVIEHLNEEEQEVFLSEIGRVLKSLGTAYVGCPNCLVNATDNVFHKKELAADEFEGLLKKYFWQVEIFGQDIFINGQRQAELFRDRIRNVSYRHLKIIDQGCDSAYSLLAICKHPKWHRAK